MINLNNSIKLNRWIKTEIDINFKNIKLSRILIKNKIKQ